jgi:serine/threonine protein kinase
LSQVDSASRTALPWIHEMQPIAPSLAASPDAIALGPFVLQRPIGAGGMGEVWQGVHTEEHVPVAIKVIGPA